MTTATTVKNTIVWFEIPSADFDRAVKFYEAVFAFGLQKMDFMGTPTAVFAYEKPAISGCIVKEDELRPGLGGSVVYIDVTGIFDKVIERVPEAGGKVVNVIDMPEGMGRAARIIDSEGNLVGLHSR